MVNTKKLVLVAAIATVTALSSTQAHANVYDNEYAKCMSNLSNKDGRTGRFVARGIAGLFSTTTRQFDRNHEVCDNYAIGVAVGEYHAVK